MKVLSQGYEFLPPYIYIYISRFLNDMVEKLFKTMKLSSKREKLKRRTLGFPEIEITITM
jgi:hypothetical protein